MDKNILEKIVELAKDNSLDNISSEEVKNLIEITEKKLDKELTGFATEDKPYTQFYEENAFKVYFPERKIAEIILGKAKVYKDKIALICGRKITYGEYYRNIKVCADALKKMGLVEGDILTIYSPSIPEAIYIFLACNLIGVITRPIDPISSPENVKKEIENTKSKALFTLDLNYKNLKEVIDTSCVEHVIAASIHDSLPLGMNIQKSFIGLLSLFFKTKMHIDLSNEKKWKSYKSFVKESINKKIRLKDISTPWQPNQTVSIISTSGSTGDPRGVEITNENIVSSVYQQMASNFNVDVTDSLFNPMPTCSSYFWDDIMLAAMYGVSTKLCPLFNAEKSPELIIDSDCSIILAGPIIIDKLCDYIEEQKSKKMPVKISNIKHIISGGDLLTYDLEKRANKILKENGCPSIIENALGTSETCGPAMVPNGMMKNVNAYYVGSTGIVLPSDEVAIFKYDKENNIRNIEEEEYNKGLLYYEIGEICLNCNNPNIFKKYYKDEVATSETKITHTDGAYWYHTGDLGYLDPMGHIFCSCRKSGLIVRDGHKIWAPKIEKLLRTIDGIKDCAVIGVSDNKDKEAPVCFICYENNIHESRKNHIIEMAVTKISLELDLMHVPISFEELSEIPRNIMMKAKVGDLNKIYQEKLSKEDGKQQILTLEKKNI